MNIDYEAIRKGNIEEYGKGTRHLSYFADLYSTRTHFIFELLQNAEDAIRRATGDAESGFAEFRLFSDRLELRHNGKLFDERDIAGVCGIGEGTKADDFTAIGKFGIGFKSIYAYTSAPQIHSGDQSFEIRRFVEPHKLPCETRPSDLPSNHTLIVMPFDGDQVPIMAKKSVTASVAVDEISAALKGFAVRSLLFLRHLREIRWILPDGSTGCFRREHAPFTVNALARMVTLLVGDNTEHWIICERRVSLPGNGSSRDALVEVGFLIQDRKIVCANDTELVVFFPTEKKTGLGFLIQGPFETTKARDNIAKDSDVNRALIEGVAQLSADSLEFFRDEGFLNLESYAALPIRPTEFLPGTFFRPIYDAIRDVLRTKALIPRHLGGFAACSEAHLARGAGLADLFSSEQLVELLGAASAVWLDTSITADKTPEFYHYLCGRKRNALPSQWEYEPLRDGIQLDAIAIAGKLTATFFEKQDENWLERFYHYAQGNYRAFSQTPFIRLEDGKHVTPGTMENPNAYLAPAVSGDIDQKIFPLVKSTVALNFECRRFLHETVKLREPNKVDEILRSRIRKYNTVSLAFDERLYAADLNAINAAFIEASPSDAERLVKGLCDIPFVASVKANGLSETVDWKKPTDQNLFPWSVEHQRWFDGNLDDEAWFEHQTIREMISQEARRRLGMDSRPLQRDADAHPNWTRKRYVKGEGLFHPLRSLYGLKWAVTHPSTERAFDLWARLLRNVDLVKGTAKTSHNAVFPDQSTNRFEGFSVLGILVSGNRWLPKRETDGFFHPRELELKDLPESFHQGSPTAEALSRALGMIQPISLGPVATALGLTEHQLQERLSFSDEEVRETLRIRAEKASDFPTEDRLDNTMRIKRIEDEIKKAPKVLREAKSRSVRVTNERQMTRTYLEQKYTKNGVLFCQMSGAPVPFKLLNNQPYFEAVELLILETEIDANHLCLSPTCAAEFKHALRTDESELRKRILSADSETAAPDVLIDVPLAEHRRIRFVPSHLSDLQTAVRLIEKQNSPSEDGTNFGQPPVDSK